MRKQLARRGCETSCQPLPSTAAGLGPDGRAPLSFLAPEPSLAVGTDPLAPLRELRQLVDGLHAAGLSVIMQVGVVSDHDRIVHLGKLVAGRLCASWAVQMHGLVPALARHSASAVNGHPELHAPADCCRYSIASQRRGSLIAVTHPRCWGSMATSTTGASAGVAVAVRVLGNHVSLSSGSPAAPTTYDCLLLAAGAMVC